MVGKIFSLSWPSAQQRSSATPPGCLTTSSIWTILVLFICLLNKEPEMENSGTGATLMWTSKLSMAPESNSRCLNKLSVIDVWMKKITRFKIFWPGDPTLEWYHDKKCESPPRYIYAPYFSYNILLSLFKYICFHRWFDSSGDSAEGCAINEGRAFCVLHKQVTYS